MATTVKVLKIRGIYDATEDAGIDCSKDVRITKQAEKDACDINKILARFERTGQLPDMIRENPQYGDFSSVLSYQDSLNVVMKAQEQFEALDARVRDRFQNDPAKMLAFCADPKNAGEMVELGLAVPKPAPLTQPAPAATPANSGQTQSSAPAAGTPSGGPLK